MRILLSSLAALVVFGCASYPRKKGFESVEIIQKETLNPYFSDASKDYVYKAKIETFDKSFGGLLIAKKLGADHHRVVFTTEMGNTIFDFSFKGDDFKVNRILKEMDRKLLINVLKRDFKVLLTENPTVLKTFENSDDIIYETKILSKKHYFYSTDGQLHRITRVGSGQEKVDFLFSGTEGETAKEIQISHKTLPLDITLHRV